MHYSVLVFIPAKTAEAAIESTVAALLEPYNENIHGHNDEFCWDWYEIGGRWHGNLLGFDCPECLSGAHWPTVHDSTKANISHKIPEDYSCNTIISPNGVWRIKEVYKIHGTDAFEWPRERYREEQEKLGAEWDKELVQVIAQHHGMLAVQVDCHD